MKIAIAGAGIGGSLLYWLLKQKRPSVQVDLYSIENKTVCKTRPCGWLVSYPKLTDIGRIVSIDFNPYVLNRFESMIFQGRKLPADVAVIDKPVLIQELLGNILVNYNPIDMSQYNRVVDATARRAYLPPYSEGLSVEIHQARYRMNGYKIPEGTLSQNSNLGYIIPLGDGTCHVGFGGTDSISAFGVNNQRVCQCSSTIWMGGPTLPFVHGNVCGIGESIGLVDPITGMGITPAMESAIALVRYWDDLPEYERQIMRRFKYMTRRRDAIRNSRTLVNTLLSFNQAAKLTGFRKSLKGLQGLLSVAGSSTFI